MPVSGAKCLPRHFVVGQIPDVSLLVEQKVNCGLLVCKLSGKYANPLASTALFVYVKLDTASGLH